MFRQSHFLFVFFPSFPLLLLLLRTPPPFSTYFTFTSFCFNCFTFHEEFCFLTNLDWITWAKDKVREKRRLEDAWKGGGGGGNYALLARELSLNNFVNWVFIPFNSNQDLTCKLSLIFYVLVNFVLFNCVKSSHSRLSSSLITLASNFSCFLFFFDFFFITIILH